MFSANENIALRKHKRRVTEYVESTLPEDVLDAGTSVMAMQVSCKAPGCVPLETVICVIFPRPAGKSASGEEGKTAPRLLPTLPESAGGTFKTTILKPMTDITKDDVLDALPPAFEGGRWSFENQCLVARDVVLNQIAKTVPGDDLEGRKLMADYVIESLQQFIQNKCVAPEPGEAFPASLPSDAEEKKNDDNSPDSGTANSNKTMSSTGQSVDQGSGKGNEDKNGTNDSGKLHRAVAESAISLGSGNFVIRRPGTGPTDGKARVSNEKSTDDNKSNQNSPTATSTKAASSPSFKSQTEWRQQQKQTGKLGGSSVVSSSSGSSIIQRLAERERHAPGLRRPGCPCCDPDNPANIADQMLGSML